LIQGSSRKRDIPRQTVEPYLRRTAERIERSAGGKPKNVRHKADGHRMPVLTDQQLGMFPFHDIRTPLNAILGFTSLALDAESKEEKEEYINIVNTNSELLMNLLNDILDISKIEAGTMDFHHKNVDFSTAFNNLTKSLKRNLKNPDVEFIVDNPYPECKVVLDFNRVAQIITNFTTNAIKHTEKGHIKVGYSCENNGIKVYAEDTGSGIPEELHEKVFQRFMKLDSVQGTGLGLSICKAITDRCGGRIGFDSKVGVGSTFWAWIPAERVE
jgi:Signal transduction histidine kinase